MTPEQAALLQTGETVLTSVTPLLPPNVQLALALATSLMNAVQAAHTAGTDITDAELAALFSADDQAKAADAAAQAAAGGTVTPLGAGGPGEEKPTTR